MGDFAAAVAGSLVGVLVGWLLLLLLRLALGRVTASLACGPGNGTTTHGATTGIRTLRVANDGGKTLDGALRTVPVAGAGAPAGVVSRAAAATVAAARVAAAAHLAVTRVLQM